MKYTFYIKYTDSNTTVKEHYNKKSLMKERFKELCRAGAFKEIKCFWLEQDSKPEERKRYNF